MILHSEVYRSQIGGDPILLLHGMGSASTAWKPILPELKESFTVVTIDLPGHGATPMDSQQKMDPESLAVAVLGTMRDLGFNKFHVVGNSLGGWIALEMASRSPSSIVSVTALAPAGLWLEPFTSRYPGTAIARMLASSLKVVSPLLLRYEWARKIGFENVSPLWEEFSYELCLDASLAMANATGYYPAWDALLKKRFEGNIVESIPVSIVFGDSDKTLPAPFCQERSLTPGHSKWILLSQCGHAPMWDHPKEVLEQILLTVKSVK